MLGLVFVVRVLCALLIWHFRGPSGFFEPDTGHYLDLAERMLHGSYEFLGIPELFRTPGYPLLLVPAVALHHPVIIALLENFLLAVLSAWLIWKIADDLLPGSRAGLWAVLLYCFEPMGLLSAEKVLTETLFTTLLLLFIWVFVRCLREPTYGNFALAGLALGCATYARPVGTYLSIALALLLLFIPRSLPISGRFRRAVLFIAVFVLSLAPWTIRNVVVADYTGFSSTGDTDLYFWCAAGVKAKLEHKTLVEEQTAMAYVDIPRYGALHPEQRNWSAGQSARFFGAEGKRVLQQHPGTYAALHARGCMIVVLDPGATELMKAVALYPESGGLLSRILDQGFLRATWWFVRNYPIAAILLPLSGLVLAVYYGLAFIGWRQFSFETRVALAIIILYFVLVSGLPGAVPRFRVPIMPVVCVCAGVGIACWKARKRQIPATTMAQSEA